MSFSGRFSCSFDALQKIRSRFSYGLLHALPLRAQRLPNLQTYLTQSCQRFGATWKFMQLMFTFNFEIKSFEVAWTTWLHDFSPPPFGFTSYVAGAVFDDIEGSFGDLDTLVLWDGRHFLIAYVDMISRDKWRTSNALGKIFGGSRSFVKKNAKSQITLARWRQVSLAPLFFFLRRACARCLFWFRSCNPLCTLCMLDRFRLTRCLFSSLCRKPQRS